LMEPIATTKIYNLQYSFLKYSQDFSWINKNLSHLAIFL
jgi:hypothetical protein